MLSRSAIVVSFGGVFCVVNWLLNLGAFVIGLAESDLVLFLFDAWYVSLRRVHISCPMLLSKKER